MELLNPSSKRARPPRTPSRRVAGSWRVAIVAGLVILSAVWARPSSATGTATPAAMLQASDEYKVKAAFLFNFARYVKWPKDTLGDPKTPFVVAVVGKNPFGKGLEDAFRDRSIDDRPLSVKHFADRGALADCNMLFIPQGEEANLEAIRAHYADRPVLLIAESIAAAQRGAQIGFYIEKSKVRFAINGEAAKRAELEVSSELMKLAKIVRAEALEQR